ncbi:MAG: 5-(carboxyamino)imidazole ribonucleotide synthase [Tenacibaculum sp.]
MNYLSLNFRLGILGGGQLGKMLLFEAQKLAISTAVLDADSESPCAQICKEFYQGDLLDFNTIYQFGKKVNLLTVEIENVNIDALIKLQAEGITILPKPENLRIIQNKALQKNFYHNNNIPTANFTSYESLQQLKQATYNKTLNFPFVWKAAKFGYDGNGVKIVNTYDDINSLPSVACIAEKLISLKSELAVIVARNKNREVKTYPVVEMKFHSEANQLEYIICPARIDDNIALKAKKIALKVVESFNFVGLLAVEMFQTQSDEILVNEVAPRTHNSGHYTVEASYTNQFEQHLRSILNLPLGSTNTKQTGVMLNLVGAEGYTGRALYQNIEEAFKAEGATVHIYGKKTTKPFRKMGHITLINSSIDKALKIAQHIKAKVKIIAE